MRLIFQFDFKLFTTSFQTYFKEETAESKKRLVRLLTGAIEKRERKWVD
jgi:hypothetical protein